MVVISLFIQAQHLISFHSVQSQGLSSKFYVVKLFNSISWCYYLKSCLFSRYFVSEFFLSSYIFVCFYTSAIFAIPSLFLLHRLRWVKNPATIRFLSFLLFLLTFKKHYYMHLRLFFFIFTSIWRGSIKYYIFNQFGGSIAKEEVKCHDD